MKNPVIWIGFLLASLMAVIQSALFPQIVILAYAPFLALCCLYAPFKEALWLAALSGFCSDSLAADPFGVHTLTATLTCAALHRTCRFFKDHPLQLCLFTALISGAALPFQLFILFLFDRRGPCQGKWGLLDFLTMPFVDAAYAFLWFVGPLLLWEWGRRQWKLWRLKKSALS
jgi:rod shape-determining protein MreD